MAKTVRISHRTAYRYDRPVEFGRHRLMVRPREGHTLRIEEATLTIEPAAKLRWHFDAFDNSIADATFEEAATELMIQSDVTLRLYPLDPELAYRREDFVPYPFQYEADNATDLLPFMLLENPTELPAIQDWLLARIPGRPESCFGFLRDLGHAINGGFDYNRREEQGTQTAAETIRSGRGTCRDFAMLFMEAARSYGFAARFVTGYLHDRGTDGEDFEGGGATHAWAEVFVPGMGWIDFDPTNRIVGNEQLIKVAATRAPGQALPITGTFVQGNATFLGMDVDVSVAEEQDDD